MRAYIQRSYIHLVFFHQQKQQLFHWKTFPRVLEQNSLEQLCSENQDVFCL